jgi:hypothetical protein
VKITSLRPDDLVLAFNREAKCLHLAPAITTEVVDQCGQVVTDYQSIDLEKGELVRIEPATGRRIVERGLWYVVLKKEAAKALSRR